MKSDGEIICLSQMSAKEGRKEELRAALETLVPLTRAEEGCIAYELWEDRDKSGAFVIYERFVSAEALERHENMPYVRHFVAHAYKSCVASFSDVEFNKLA